MKTATLDELTETLRQLDLDIQQDLDKLTAKTNRKNHLQAAVARLRAQTTSTSSPRRFQPGDIVRLRTKGKTGRVGDRAVVLSHKTNVSVRLDRTGTATWRVPYNLDFIAHADGN